MFAGDPFRFFRFFLAVIASVYATVITLQSLWGWYVWLAGPDRYVSLVRRYVLLHGLRVRMKTFGGDALVCLLLCVAFFILWHSQTTMDYIQQLQHASNAPLHLRR